MSELAWWYGPETLPHGDGRKVAIGETHTVEGEVVLCKNGLHGSKLPFDALQYGLGLFWRTKHSGHIVHGDDKLTSSKRTYVGVVRNTDEVLQHFARLCALDVVHLWDAPDVVVKYLRTGDEGLRDTARTAAWAAAEAFVWDDAAWDAAWAAARAAGWSAARDAAWDAARAAARAAWDATRASARAAARGKQNESLHRMLIEALEEAEP
jgi:hypothetical protein